MDKDKSYKHKILCLERIKVAYLVVIHKNIHIFTIIVDKISKVIHRKLNFVDYFGYNLVYGHKYI